MIEAYKKTTYKHTMAYKHMKDLKHTKIIRRNRAKKMHPLPDFYIHAISAHSEDLNIQM